MRVLYVDTSVHGRPWPLFLRDLCYLASQGDRGFSYEFVDEAKFLESKSIANRAMTRGLDWITINVRGSGSRGLAYKAGGLLGYRRHPMRQAEFNSALVAAARRLCPHVVLVVMGFDVWPETLERIKRETGAVLINYATDDPFNWRTGTHEVRECISVYDVYACTKNGIIDDVIRAGVRNVQYVRFGYHPSVHFVEACVSSEERERFAADVAFVGEADADRAPIFRALVKALPNLNLALYGGLWRMSSGLGPYCRGTVRGREFRLALHEARIAVNLVRVQNRDDHVMRTFEGPACGAFMLNQRTEQHLELFAEDRGAAYFESVEELVEKVRYFLERDGERLRIQRTGHCTVMNNRHTYEDRLKQILGMSRAAAPEDAADQAEVA